MNQFYAQAILIAAACLWLAWDYGPWLYQKVSGLLPNKGKETHACNREQRVEAYLTLKDCVDQHGTDEQRKALASVFDCISHRHEGCEL